MILRAVAEPDLPHFLILDEMNLSHVERYFADLLSAIESGEPVLCTLATLCFAKRTWTLNDEGKEFAHLKGLRAEEAKAARVEDESLDPLGLTPEGTRTYPPTEAYYRQSFEKILRMLERHRANGFTSFSEA